MSKCSRVVTSAVHGIVTSQFHPHWGDVNPLKRQGLTRQERIAEANKYDAQIAKEKREHERRAARGSRILPALCR